MTTPASLAARITVTIRDTSTALTYTHESIVIPAGAPTTEQLHSVLSAIVDTLTTPLNGEISFEDSWEMTITMSQRGEHGLVENSPRPNEKTSRSTTETNFGELNFYD